MRNKWYMRRRLRAVVPAPSNTPMPDKQPNAESKARLYSLYLRPWVLDSGVATEEVPHLSQLDVVPNKRHDGMRRRVFRKQPEHSDQGRSYADAWHWYIRGNVVTKHACKLITQFMAACCSKTKRQEGDEMIDPDKEQHLRSLPENKLSLDRVHNLLTVCQRNQPKKQQTKRRKQVASQKKATTRTKML